MRAGARRIGPLAIIALLVASVAQGIIPSAERVADAVAKANRSSGRSDALRLDLALRIGGGEPVATGQLVTHPTGMARLELVKRGEFVERHILLGTEHLVARNGRLVDKPRAFLPPLFLLQATSAVSLEAALHAHGVAAESVGLAPCGDSDCYVLGDPSLVPPPLPVAPDEEAESAEGALEGEPLDVEDDALEPPAPEPVDDGPRAAVWIETDGYEIRRLESVDGVRVVLGPPASFDKLRVPAWLEIREPRHVPVTLEILRATAVNAPANAFAREWLFAAPPPPAESAAPEPGEP